MKFIALKTDDGRITGNISFYCIALDVSRWGFYKYLKNRDNPWKYEAWQIKCERFKMRIPATIHTVR